MSTLVGIGRQGTRAPTHPSSLAPIFFGASPGACLTIDRGSLPHCMPYIYPSSTHAPHHRLICFLVTLQVFRHRQALRHRALRHPGPSLRPLSLRPPSLGPHCLDPQHPRTPLRSDPIALGPQALSPRSLRTPIARTPFIVRTRSSLGPRRSNPLARTQLLGPNRSDPIARTPSPGLSSLGPHRLDHHCSHPHCSDPHCSGPNPCPPPIALTHSLGSMAAARTRLCLHARAADPRLVCVVLCHVCVPCASL